MPDLFWHPVPLLIHWIPACAGMTRKSHARPVLASSSSADLLDPSLRWNDKVPCHADQRGGIFPGNGLILKSAHPESY